MSGPKRIQLRRTKGWRKPAGAIVVARPSKWGNPFQVISPSVSQPYWDVMLGPDVWRREPTRVDAIREAVDLFAIHLGPMGIHELDDWDLGALRIALRGHDLACWCPLDQPCHADVLLELANR